MSTVQFNPDANPESTSVDGKVARTGSPDTFSNVRTGSGDTVSDSAVSEQAPIIQATSTSNQFGRIDRGVLLFDTSSLPDGATITAASVQLYVTSATDGFTGGSISLVATTPASNTSLATSDYNIASWTMTKQATDVPIASIVTSSYNTWTLNATGIASISTTGITKFGLVTAYDADNSAPTWSSGATAEITWNSADGTNKPILNVTYTDANTGASFLLNFT